MSVNRYGHGGDVWGFFRQSGKSVKEVLDYSANINPLGFPEEAGRVIQETIPELVYYPEPRAAELRERLAECYGVQPEEVIVGNGAAELIFLYCRVLEREFQGYMPAPTFSEYALAAAAAGGRVEHLKLREEENYAIVAEKMLSLLDARKPAGNSAGQKSTFFLCNPNNPTGLHMETPELHSFSEELSKRGIGLFVDLSFWGFVPGALGMEHALPRFPVQELMSAVKEADTGGGQAGEVTVPFSPFFLFSYTKFFALPGIRLGYGIGPQPLITAMEKQREPWSINIMAQKAGMQCIEAREYAAQTLQLIRQEREYLQEELRKIGTVKVYPSTCNFLLCSLQEAGISAPQLKEKLQKDGIMIRDASNFPGLSRYYIRLAIRSRRENEILLEKLTKAMKG